jgi:hypothetical protein
MKKRLIVTLAGLLALGVMAPAATGWISNWAELTEEHPSNRDDKDTTTTQKVEWTLAEGEVNVTDNLSLYFDVEKNYNNITNGEEKSTTWDNTFGVSYDLGKSGDWDLSVGLGYDYDTNADNSTKLSEYYPWFSASTALTDNLDLTLWGAMFYNNGASGTHGDDYELDIVFSTGKLGIFDKTSFPIYLYHDTSGGTGSNERTSIEIEPSAFTTLYKNDSGVYVGLEYYLDAEFGDKVEEWMDAHIGPKVGWSKSLDNDVSVWAYTSYEVISVNYSEGGDWWSDNEFQAVVGAKAKF